MSPVSLDQKLSLTDFEALAGELKTWRTDPEIAEAIKAKGSALILDFVKGLRLSARLIYALRTALSTFPVEVNWGHLLSSSGGSISPECDVIVHKKGIIQEWNGNAKPVMDFKFIHCNQAIAVISCKSYFKSIDKAYYKLVKPYVKHVLLFAECCPPGNIRALKIRAKKAGYDGLWYLYDYDKDAGTTNNAVKEWQNFLLTLKKICAKKSKRS
jgi:hypothetical protein